MPNPVFSCPKCHELLGDIPLHGELVSVCPRCRLKYEVLRGRVTASDVRQVAANQSSHGPARYKQSYDVRLQLPNGRIDVVSFELAGDEVIVVGRPGDIVSVVRLMRGSQRELLLSIHNATTGRSIAISTPGEKATAKAWALGAVVGLTVFVSVAASTGSAKFALAAGVVTLVGLGVGLGYRFMPRAQLSPEQEAQLTLGQRMLAEKLELEAARAKTMRELEARRELRVRLTSLRTKMVNVALDVYRPRIEALDVALATIDQQLELESRLRAGYEKSIQMLEIEIEAGAAADALDTAAASHIAATMAEMKELEIQQAELGRQLAANAEVEGLLKNATA